MKYKVLIKNDFEDYFDLYNIDEVHQHHDTLLQGYLLAASRLFTYNHLTLLVCGSVAHNLLLFHSAQHHKSQSLCWFYSINVDSIIPIMLLILLLLIIILLPIILKIVIQMLSGDPTGHCANLPRARLLQEKRGRGQGGARPSKDYNDGDWWWWLWWQYQ